MSSKATVTLWLESPNTWNVKVWARCGSLPTATAYDQMFSTAPRSSYPNWHGARLDLPACASGWYISVTNSDAVDRVFHLVWGAHNPAQELTAVRVGIAVNATPSELAQIQQALRRAAWRFYAMTGGTFVLRDYRLINNANQCDDAWPVDQYACEGTACRLCLVDGVSPACRSYTQGNGKISLCRDDWYSPNVIAHEFGHSFVGLPDEYHDTTSDCCCHAA